MTEPITHIEMIIDYTTDGTDYQYCDNKGVLIRCGECKYWRTKEAMYYCPWDEPEATESTDYCSRAVKR